MREELSERDGKDGEAIGVAKIEGRGEAPECVGYNAPNIPSVPVPSRPIHCEIKPLRSLFAAVPGRHFDLAFPFRSHSEGRTIDIDAMYERIIRANRGMDLNENCENCEILCSIL